MSILSDFEDRVGGALEGVFAGVFRSPVQPVEIAKALAKAMDDGRTVGVGRVYAPVSFTVALSPEDGEKFGAFTATLAGELATYLTDHARERRYHLAAKPAVSFVEHDDLRLGRFRVSAELAHPEEVAQARAPVRSAGPVAAPPSGPVAAPPSGPVVSGPVAARSAGPVLFDQEADDAASPSTAPADGPPAEAPLAYGVPAYKRPGYEAPDFASETRLATVTVGDTDHDVALRGDRVVVGRLRDCDICLPDANISRRHAAFVRKGGDWDIEDLDSTNRTYLNGSPIERARLHDGDVIEIGVTRLTYHNAGR
jgi:predicted component of type VI protein secretion system